MDKVHTAGQVCPRACQWARFPKRQAAFSLVEVVLALGVAAFALVVLIGLLPVGLQANRESRQENIAVNLLAALVSDLKYSPKTASSVLYALPKVSDPSNTNSQGLQAAASITNAFSEGQQLLAAINDPNARFEAIVTRQSVYTNSLNPVLYTFIINPLPRSANSSGQGILEAVVAIPGS